MSEEAILSALAIAFAALCVWLTVRVTNRHEGWVKRTDSLGGGLYWCESVSHIGDNVAFPVIPSNPAP